MYDAFGLTDHRPAKGNPFAGCDVVFQDTASGSTTGRKGLTDALTSYAAGDVLMV